MNSGEISKGAIGRVDREFLKKLRIYGQVYTDYKSS